MEFIWYKWLDNCCKICLSFSETGKHRNKQDKWIVEVIEEVYSQLKAAHYF